MNLENFYPKKPTAFWDEGTPVQLCALIRGYVAFLVASCPQILCANKKMTGIAGLSQMRRSIPFDDDLNRGSACMSANVCWLFLRGTTQWRLVPLAIEG